MNLISEIKAGKHPFFSFKTEEHTPVLYGNDHYSAMHLYYKDILIASKEGYSTYYFPTLINNISYSLENVLDYYIYIDTVHKPFLKTKQPRKRWWDTLNKRMDTYSTKESLETCKRVALAYSHIEKLKVLNPMMAAKLLSVHVVEYSTKDIVYRYTRFPQEIRYIRLYKVDQDPIETYCYADALTQIGNYVTLKSDNLGTTVMQGENYPTPVIEKGVADGSIIHCTECSARHYLSSSHFHTEIFANDDGAEYQEGVFLCPVCAPEDPARAGESLLSSSTRATDFFKFKRSKDLRGKTKSKYMGVELEFEARGAPLNKGIKYTKKHTSTHAIIKRDGSLTNGLEICSAPADIDVHLEEFKPFFTHFKFSSLHASNNTGMHVHVGKGKPVFDVQGKKIGHDILNPLTLGKLTYFMSKESNKEFLINIAGRENAHYARLGTAESLSKYFTKGDSGKYHALNTSPSETIEFRIFATPERYTTFAKNMEFCDALTEYCRPGNSSFADMSHEKFTSYVKKNRGQYKHLTRFLAPELFNERKV